MSDFKTIDALNYYSSLAKADRKLTEEERNFAYNLEIEIAKSILQDFGENTSKTIAKIILAVTE